MPIYLLGPDQWLDDHDRERPVWMDAPADGASTLTPKDLRRGLAKHMQLETSGLAEGVVMECQEGEDFVDCFQRIEREHQIEHYFFIIPSDTKMHGTEYEGGMLSRDFRYGMSPHITLFLEETLSEVSHDGARVPRFQKDQRTRYLHSLVQRSNVRWWRQLEHLADQVARTSRALVAEPY